MMRSLSEGAQKALATTDPTIKEAERASTKEAIRRTWGLPNVPGEAAFKSQGIKGTKAPELKANIIIAMDLMVSMLPPASDGAPVSSSHTSSSPISNLQCAFTASAGLA